MTEKKKTPSFPTCGIIMPISLIENCPPEHWQDVLGIIKDVCDENGFIPNLVSDADDIGVIHNRIIENIYSSDIVICDVSCKNANVMFELGMRLAFDKPTIIIKDDQTGYSFDTSLIEHLEYPRDLRFTSINRFKVNLGNKLRATFEKSQKDPNYSTFLKNFGKYKIAHLEEREVTSDTLILKVIEELRTEFRTFKNDNSQPKHYIQRKEHFIPKSNSGKILYPENSDFPAVFISKYVNDYIKQHVNPSAPFNSDEIVEEITNSLLQNKLVPMVKDKSMLEKFIRDIIELY